MFILIMSFHSAYSQSSGNIQFTNNGVSPVPIFSLGKLFNLVLFIDSSICFETSVQSLVIDPFSQFYSILEYQYQ